MRVIGKKNVFNIFFVGVLCAAVFCVLQYCLRGEGTSGDGDGAKGAGGYIQQAGEHNRSAEGRAERIEEQRDAVERELRESIERVREDERRFDVIEAGVGEISECARFGKQVIDGIRERDEKKGQDS